MRITAASLGPGPEMKIFDNLCNNETSIISNRKLTIPSFDLLLYKNALEEKDRKDFVHHQDGNTNPLTSRIWTKRAV